MSKKDDLIHIKTGAISRRLGLTRASLKYGARSLLQSSKELWVGREAPQSRKQRQKNIQQFVREVGELKGSIVKIGQLFATYGEYILSPEVTLALHGLAENTPPMSWGVIEKTVRHELGEVPYQQLKIRKKPIAAASIGQVHRAVERTSNKHLCLKVQYPGVAKTIDADFNALIRLMKLSRLLDSTRAIDALLVDFRQLLHQEMDYHQEGQALLQVGRSLAKNSSYVVPTLYPNYCTGRVLCMSYEEGLVATAHKVQALSQARRNDLGRSLLGLLILELFEWRSMQTDPNLGNYRVRISETGKDQWVLLDFGAMRTIPKDFSIGFNTMILAAVTGDRKTFIEQSIALDFMKSDFPRQVLEDFANLGMLIVEPLRKDLSQIPSCALNARGEYLWREAQLPKRVAKAAIKASLSQYFMVPPTTFMYIMRKLIGMYSIIATLDAQFSGNEVLEPYL